MQSEDGEDRSKAELEYVGMGSVFTVIFNTAFVHLPRAFQSAIATIFRIGIDSDRLRPYTKHAEWYSFLLVFAAAMWVVVYR